MRLKQLLSKSLLVAAGLGVGASAWGQTTSFASDKNATYTCGQVLKDGNTDILTFTLGGLEGTDTWNPNGGNKGLSTGNAAIITDGAFVSGTYYIVTPKKDLKLDLAMYMPNGNTYFYVDKSDAIGTHVYDHRRPNGKSESNWRSLSCEKLLAGTTYYIYSNGNGAGINSFTATTYEGYTIHYVDNSATPVTIKSDVKHEGLYGTEVTASSEDMANVTYDGKVYSYKSGNKTITLGTNANEITLVYATASQYNYTINAVSDGSTIQELATGTKYQGDTYGIYLKEVLNIDNKQYILDDAGNSDINKYYAGYTMGEEDATKEINYTLDNDVVAFFECENMTYSHNHYQTLSANHSADRYTASNGNAVCIYSANNIKTENTIAAGVYEIGLNVCYYWRSNSTTVKLQYSTDGTDWNDITTWSCAANETGLKTTMAIIPAASYLRLLDTTGATPSHFFDYLIVKKAYVTVNIAEGKEFATFNSDYALDFTGITDVLAYTAKLNAAGTEVTLTKVEGKVPANTGLLVRGKTASVPATVYDGTVENEFIAVTAANCDEGQDYKTVTEGYILATVDGVQGFYKANSTSGTKVGKGKAYLPATGSNGARLTLNFGDETTAVEAVEVVENASEAVYNLQGQRVAAPQKGLYIVNGKKVVLK